MRCSQQISPKRWLSVTTLYHNLQNQILATLLTSNLVVCWSAARMWIRTLFTGHILGTFLCFRTACQQSWKFIVDRQNSWVNGELEKEHIKDDNTNFNPRTVYVSCHGSLNLIPCILWQRYLKYHKIIQTHKTHVKKLLIYESRTS
jgi:hypothetical protein